MRRSPEEEVVRALREMSERRFTCWGRHILENGIASTYPRKPRYFRLGIRARALAILVSIIRPANLLLLLWR
jgi:hypothetical protein